MLQNVNKSSEIPKTFENSRTFKIKKVVKF